MKDWEKLLLKPDDTIQQALRVIDAASSQLALVADTPGRLLGIVTDGNIRRGLLAGRTLADPVSAVMNTAPTTVRPDMGAHAALALMWEHEFTHLPVVDENGLLLNCWSRKSLLTETVLDTPVALMAGGLGSRLGQLTENCPKPMLKVGGKPLLEIILQSFLDHGFRNFFIAVNHHAVIIEEYFGDGAGFGVSIRYLREKKRLGTAGALSMLPKGLSRPVIVMNGDILTRFNPRLLLETHNINNAAATMVVRRHEMQAPYGVVRSSPEGRLLDIEEKPVLPFCIHAGINVLSSEALSLVPKNSFFDIPDLFKEILARNMPAQVYEINEYWLDIGRMADFEQAANDYQKYWQVEQP